jgi:hypothetical protein
MIIPPDYGPEDLGFKKSFSGSSSCGGLLSSGKNGVLRMPASMGLFESEKSLPVSLVIGFLGKTTLLSRVLRQDAMKDSAVIINEHGEVNLDRSFVERVDGSPTLTAAS